MTAADLPSAHSISEMNADDIGHIGRDQLNNILSDSRIALVAVGPEDAIVGFCLAIDPTSKNQTDRAAWALAEASPDLHLERVAFDMQYSGLGLGLALYDELDARIAKIADEAPGGTVTLTSLVRLEPPNQHAIGFHAARDFDMVAEASFDEVLVGLAIKTFTA